MLLPPCCLQRKFKPSTMIWQEQCRANLQKIYDRRAYGMEWKAVFDQNDPYWESSICFGYQRGGIGLLQDIPLLL